MLKLKKLNYFIIFSCLAIILSFPLISTALTESSKYVEDIIYSPEVSLGVAYIANIKDYIILMHAYAVRVAVILGVIVLMYHFFRLALSAGNSDVISSAKDGAFSAIIGIAIAIGSVLLLNNLNARITNLDHVFSVEKIYIGLDNDLTLYDLPVCDTSASFSNTSCKDTSCGEICVLNGEQCRGAKCTSDTKYATDACKTDMDACDCAPKGSQAFGEEGSYECQLDACAAAVSNAIAQNVPTKYLTAENRDISEANQLVSDYLCQYNNTYTMAGLGSKLEHTFSSSEMSDVASLCIDQTSGAAKCSDDQLLSKMTEEKVQLNGIDVTNSSQDNLIEYCHENAAEKNEKANSCDFGLNCKLQGGWKCFDSGMATLDADAYSSTATTYNACEQASLQIGCQESGLSGTTKAFSQ